METMTLEELRSLVRQSPVAGVDVGAIEVGIDAAIRERDELRAALNREEEGHDETRRALERDYEQEAAAHDKTKSALAALRKRIANSKIVSLGIYPAHGSGFVGIVTEPKKDGKRFRLVEDADV